ncbi:hypothetical protein [Nonomuraea sp. NPDC049480]|uniref:hypothetical protein n=1 Tax=Nonomuraea sp. NPDC049480 TaxID=3364353 RepID=UPI0037B841D4
MIAGPSIRNVHAPTSTAAAVRLISQAGPCRTSRHTRYATAANNAFHPRFARWDTVIPPPEKAGSAAYTDRTTVTGSSNDAHAARIVRALGDSHESPMTDATDSGSIRATATASTSASGSPVNS